MEKAFQTSLHYYQVSGVQHYANSSAPSVPTAFASVVGEIHGLNDFRPAAPKARAHPLSADALAAHSLITSTPRETSSSGEHYLAPGDIATIYNIAPVYAAGTTGSGAKVVVVGQTAVTLSDLEQFRCTSTWRGAIRKRCLRRIRAIRAWIKAS